jgi:hypothetical protein
MNSSTILSLTDGYGFNATVLSLAVIACSVMLLSQILGTLPDTKEPRFISSRIPYIGHTLGILQHKMRYYTILRRVIVFGLE